MLPVGIARQQNVTIPDTLRADRIFPMASCVKSVYHSSLSSFIASADFARRASVNPSSIPCGSKTRCSLQRSQDNDDGCEVSNFRSCEAQWMNGCYVDLRIRSNSLLRAEASRALHQHFQEEDRSRTNEDAGTAKVTILDEIMLASLGGSSFEEKYGHLVNRFNCGVTSFMEEPFC